MQMYDRAMGCLLRNLLSSSENNQEEDSSRVEFHFIGTSLSVCLTHVSGMELCRFLRSGDLGAGTVGACSVFKFSLSLSGCSSTRTSGSGLKFSAAAAASPSTAS